MSTATDVVRALQDRVNVALLGSDWETLTSLVSPDARIIGPKGFMIDRDTWVGVHQETQYEQVRLEPSETEVHIYGTVGIRVDVVASECRYQGQTITGRFRVCQVWALGRQRWQLVAVQYTSVVRSGPTPLAWCLRERFADQEDRQCGTAVTSCEAQAARPRNW
jgi:hypothetical protein